MTQNPLERQRSERRVALVLFAAFLLVAAMIQAIREALPSPSAEASGRFRPPVTQSQP